VTDLVGAIDADVLHATTVAIGHAGVMIVGPAGSGKSSLALQMIALGARLVADDQTCLASTDDGVIASAPATLRGLIEARFVGILNAPVQDSVAVRLVVDLAQVEASRLPPRRTIRVNGRVIDLVFGHSSAHFPASLMCYAAGGRHQ
jgi:HPr kinase/phosphorylase